MISVATLLWDPNAASQGFSRVYNDEWVIRLCNGFARNLTEEFRFVLYTDRERGLPACIEQRRIKAAKPDYGTCIEPYELSADGPMILVGLDTLVIGNIDHLARSAAERTTLGLPRDPYRPSQACNGVALVPQGMERVASEHRGENDMEWVRRFPHAMLDDEWPGQVVSWKGHVERHGAGDARIIYFHGERKLHQLASHPIIREHWR